MVKRKAKELGDVHSVEEPRRSSRRITHITGGKPEAKSENTVLRPSKKKTTKLEKRGVKEATGILDDVAEEVG